MAPWASSVPAALAGLLAALRSEPGLAGVTIYDGPVVTASPALEAVIAGWSGHAGDDLAVEATVTGAGLAPVPGREQYAIRCAVLVLDASANMDAARARAYVLLAACFAAVAADQKLGGAVMSARPGTSSLQQDQGPGGATATVGFTIACDAFTGR